MKPMNNEEAKSILQGYRSNGADANDPIFAEALAQVKKDPELSKWFAAQQAFDRAMSAEFEAVPVPADLLQKIVRAKEGRAPERSRVVWWRQPLGAGLAVAASIAVFISLAVAFWPKPKLLAANSKLADFAISDAQHPKTHGGKGEEAAELNRMLKLPTTRLGDPLPANFDTLRNTGCRTLNVEGRDVLEVCFKRNGAGLHCYIARQQDFPNLTAPQQPVVVDKPDASVATWSDGSNLYIVVTKPDRAALEKLLK